MDVLEVVEQGWAVIPGHPVRPLDDVVAVERRDRDEPDVVDVESRRPGAEVGHDPLVRVLVVSDQIHLVDGDHEVRDTQQRCDEGVASGLLDDARPSIDQDDRQIGFRRPGDHVPRVLNVARRVGDDELSASRREVPIGDIDGDPLLALGAEAIHQQGQVDLGPPSPAAGALERGQLVVEDLLRLVQQTTDERALAVVHGADRREPEQVKLHRPLSCGGVGVQKYPSRFRSSIAVSENVSSARVAPRSLIRAAAVSLITSATVRACEATAPVDVMSPTVR